MRRLSIITAICIVFGCSSPEKKVAENKKEICDSQCLAKNASRELSCKLSTPELKQRKATVLASLRKQIVEKRELTNGYAFKFSGADSTIDELVEFIKTERTCCDFFTFNLSIAGDGGEVWLELTGVEGAKDFITQELEL